MRPSAQAVLEKVQWLSAQVLTHGLAIEDVEPPCAPAPAPTQQQEAGLEEEKEEEEEDEEGVPPTPPA